MVGPAAARALVHRCARRPISPCGATPPRNYHPSRGALRPGAGHRTWMNRTAPCCAPSRVSCIHRCAAPGARARARSVCAHRRLAALCRWQCCWGRGPVAAGDAAEGAAPCAHGAALLPALGLAPARARTCPAHGLTLAPAPSKTQRQRWSCRPAPASFQAHHSGIFHGLAMAIRTA